MKYAEVSLKGFGRYVVPINEVGEYVQNDLCHEEEGAEVTVRLVSMTDSEYASLSEFQGH